MTKKELLIQAIESSAVREALAILQESPDAAHGVDGHEVTALSCMLDHCPNELELLRRLVNAWPEALRTKNGNGHYPVHSVLSELWTNTEHSSKVAFEVIEYLITQDPGSLRLPDDEGNLPIHHIAFEESPYTHYLTEETVERDLVQGNGYVFLPPILLPNRGLLLQRNDDEQMPIHAVLWSFPNRPMIRYLVEEAPETLTIPDAEGCIPLDIALPSKSDEPIELEEYTELLFPEANHRLHFICRYCRPPSVAVLQKCIEEFNLTDQLQHVDASGHLPLYWAVRNLKWVESEAILKLVDLYPGALLQRDGCGAWVWETVLLSAPTATSLIFIILRQCPAFQLRLSQTALRERPSKKSRKKDDDGSLTR